MPANSLRSRAPRWIKRVVWNVKAPQFAQASAPASFVERVLVSLGPDSRLLDLGCGSGNLGKALRKLGWKGQYCGVDISEHAIDAARNAGELNSEWHTSAIEDFIPCGLYDAICFVESIYYVHPQSLKKVLSRCCEHLRQPGNIYVRICNEQRHADTVQFIRHEFPQVVIVIPQTSSH